MSTPSNNDQPTPENATNDLGWPDQQQPQRISGPPPFLPDSPTSITNPVQGPPQPQWGGGAHSAPTPPPAPPAVGQGPAPTPRDDDRLFQGNNFATRETPRPRPEQHDEHTSVISAADMAKYRAQAQTPNSTSGGGFFTDTAAPEESGSPAGGWQAGNISPQAQPLLNPTSPADAGLSFQSPGVAFGVEDQVAAVRRPVGKGWRKAVAAMTFGLITPGPSSKEEKEAELERLIMSPLLGVFKVAVISDKGGVGKTTTAVAMGSAIARKRGDRVIAVDAKIALGSTARRFRENGGPEANVQGLANLRDASHYAAVRVHTVQNDDRLEVLGSQNDPRSTYKLTPQDYTAVMAKLGMHYNVVLLDCGDGVSSPLFTTLMNDVDCVVVVASQDVDSLNGAWSTLEWLHAHGFGKKLASTIVALNDTDSAKATVDLDDVEQKFRERGLNVVRIPYDPHLATGSTIEFSGLKKKTQKQFMALAGAVAQHYPTRQPQHRSDSQGGF